MGMTSASASFTWTCCRSAGGAQALVPNRCLLVMPCNEISDLDTVLILMSACGDDEAILHLQ
uniref:Uncharacterized protein n=1 Tax=Rhizophora mucronata TaxID=61149 RepID=A0A2P2IW18_RHIMU